ncbi:hypothetical protein LCGC14_0452550 [marine sediment metagenome]|uniref:Isopropylmalate dehydrogenase-like domain-containing protein n=1 Tax=marine sediment metagenome TaxID=412755 RepID=A0A0F9SMP0_9ZZZZ
MTVHSATLITGDGVGPELAAAGRRCVDAALEKTPGAGRIEWALCEAGVDVMEAQGTPMPEATIQSVRDTDVTLKAPITTPIGEGFRSVNVLLRQTLDLYACLRPCKSYPGVRSRYENIDLVVVRENCEDLYAGVEFAKGQPATAELIGEINRLATDRQIRTSPETTGLSIKPISVENSERIVRFAFDYARANGRRKVTAIHKANIMKHTDGLFKEVAESVAAKYTDIEFEERLIDNMCMQLVQKPELYDVLVTENLYGDIISDLCAGLVGGLGVAPGANIGENGAVFEATHGSAPKYQGLNKVNPPALILSGMLMLRYMGWTEAADLIIKGVGGAIGAKLEQDFDGSAQGEGPLRGGGLERCPFEVGCDHRVAVAGDNHVVTWMLGTVVAAFNVDTAH